MPASTIPLAKQDVDFRLRASIHAAPWQLDRRTILAPGDVHAAGEHWIGSGPTAANLVLDDL